MNPHICATVATAYLSCKIIAWVVNVTVYKIVIKYVSLRGGGGPPQPQNIKDAITQISWQKNDVLEALMQITSDT